MGSFLSPDSQNTLIDHDCTIGKNLSIEAEFDLEPDPTYDDIEERPQAILDLRTHDRLDLYVNYEPEATSVSNEEDQEEKQTLCGLLDPDGFVNDNEPPDGGYDESVADHQETHSRHDDTGWSPFVDKNVGFSFVQLSDFLTSLPLIPFSTGSLWILS